MSDAQKRRPRDYRLPIAASTILAVILLGYVFSLVPGRAIEAKPSSPFSSLEATRLDEGHRKNSTESAQTEEPLPWKAARALSVAEHHITQQQFKEAITTLNAARTQLQDVPRAYQLLANALEGMRDYATARDFYTAAIDRDPLLADAYWGVAATSEALGDLEAALGAMRSYLHTEPDKDPNRLKIAQARAAIWEWEAQLGRGPWGPTKGIPPGFTADDIKRDGRGVAIRMEQEGSGDAEIKHAEKRVIFPRP